MEKRITSGVLKEILLKELEHAKDRGSSQKRSYTFHDGKGNKITEAKSCRTVFLTDFEINVIINLVINHL